MSRFQVEKKIFCPKIPWDKRKKSNRHYGFGHACKRKNFLDLVGMQGLPKISKKSSKAIKSYSHAKLEGKSKCQRNRNQKCFISQDRKIFRPWF